VLADPTGRVWFNEDGTACCFFDTPYTDESVFICSSVKGKSNSRHLFPQPDIGRDHCYNLVVPLSHSANVFLTIHRIDERQLWYVPHLQGGVLASREEGSAVEEEASYFGFVTGENAYLLVSVQVKDTNLPVSASNEQLVPVWYKGERLTHIELKPGREKVNNKGYHHKTHLLSCLKPGASSCTVMSSMVPTATVFL